MFICNMYRCKCIVFVHVYMSTYMHICVSVYRSIAHVTCAMSECTRFGITTTGLFFPPKIIYIILYDMISHDILYYIILYRIILYYIVLCYNYLFFAAGVAELNGDSRTRD